MCKDDGGRLDEVQAMCATFEFGQQKPLAVADPLPNPFSGKSPWSDCGDHERVCGEHIGNSDATAISLI